MGNDKGRLTKEEVERIVAEAEKYKQADEAQKGKIEAKNGLENYCFSMRNSLDEEKIKAHISDEDRKSIDDKISETLKWLDEHADNEKEEYKEKQKELEGVANPIMMKAYQAAGGAPGGAGMPGGGMPGGMPGQGGPPPANPPSGPSVEEVD